MMLSDYKSGAWNFRFVAAKYEEHPDPLCYVLCVNAHAERLISQ